MIIDTHIHCWDLKRARYEWLDDDTTILNRNYSFADLRPELQSSGVVSGVLVQAANNLDDTELMLEAARAFPAIAGVVTWLPLERPEEVEKLLNERFKEEPYLKGVRHLIHNEADVRWLLREPVMESLAILASKDIPYDVVGVIPAHLETVLDVAARIPGLRMMLDHLNQPPISTGGKLGRWGELMAEATQHQQIWCKISGLGTATNKQEDWSSADIKPYVAYVLDHFGSHRCVCGGDWPVSLLAGSYARTWQVYREVIGSLLPPIQQAAVYHGNAKTFYNLETGR